MATFQTHRRPQVKVHVPGRNLREGIKFVDGKYQTDDETEIELLRSKEYIEEVEESEEDDQADDADSADEDDGGDK